MFRRRPGRRPLLGRRRAPLLPRVRRALIRANRLMSNGRFAEAAAIFDRLSEGAKQRDMPVRAADLALQASRAHFAADNLEVALERAREALRLFVCGDRPGRVTRVLSRMTAALREKGYDAEAAQLEQDAAQILEEMGLSLEEAKQRAPRVVERRGALPAQCKGCGASLVPDEVEWHDAYTAECLYCATVVRAS